jgi:hypothetical protein
MHAVRQVQDWKSWIQQNRDFAEKRLRELTESKKAIYAASWGYLEMNPDFRHGFTHQYIVVAGRHRDLSSKESVRLTQMNEDLAGIAIITYDKIIARLLESIGYQWDGLSWSNINQ